jgi:hypothetical protein
MKLFSRGLQNASGPEFRESGLPEAEVEVGGWSTGARANTTALVRWTAWGLLLLGPLLGGAAWMKQPATAARSAQSAPPAPRGAGSQGAAGFAQLFVGAYVRAGEGDQELLAAFYPGADGVRLEGESGARAAEHLTVARLRQTAPSVWSVTVAARLSPTDHADRGGGREQAGPDEGGEGAAGVRYFQVPVATGPAAGSATGYVALALPAEVGAPPRIETPELAYGPMQPAAPSDPRTEAVTDFLAAYLTGSGDLGRYLAPGTQLSPITPARYTGLAVDSLAIAGEDGAQPSTTVPEDGTHVQLLATVRATDHAGVRRPLTYALTLSARAGRWEIASIDGAPSPAPPQPTAPASPTN